MMRRNKLYLLILILALLIPTTLVYAAIDSVILNDGANDAHRVDLVEWVNNPDGTTTFTYAVTDIGAPGALSHWVLGIGSCLGTNDEFLVSPQAGTNYTTPTDIEACTDGTYPACQEVSYGVETGFDGSTGFSGVKYNINGEGLSAGQTHIFQITVNNFLGLTEVPLLSKYGSLDTGGEETIQGPECAVPTAISLSSTNVESLGSNALLPLALAMFFMMTMATATVAAWRKRVNA